MHIKREDLVHPSISGNKFRKLKYNILAYHEQHAEGLLTFGGAYSNHIEAVSVAGNELNIKTYGIIRGDELKGKPLNPTLKKAHMNGMNLFFVTREEYRKKDDIEIFKKYIPNISKFYILPEGGTNSLAVKGCEEILLETDKQFDYICSSVGTGGTIAGLINSTNENQKVIGFSALKGDFLNDTVNKMTHKNNWAINTDYHFNGYAKITPELITFINKFKEDFNIQLDPIYTGKMMFGIMDLIKNNKFKKNTSILAIHTGGLQSIDGMNIELKRKGMPLILN